jgi:hypothetical protein
MKNHFGEKRYQARSKNCERGQSAPSCPSVRIKQLGCQWTDFHEIWYLRILRKSIE